MGRNVKMMAAAFPLIVCMFLGLAAVVQSAERKSATVGLCLKSITNDEFMRVASEEMKRVVEQAGYTFELVLAGGQTEVSAQVNNVEDMINKGVDAIIVAPMDRTVLLPAFEKAKRAGIPVILIDAGIEKGNDELFVTLVAADAYKIGKVGGEEMVKALGSGKVGIVRGAAGSDVSESRSAGFVDALEGTDVKVVNQQNGDWANEKAMQVTENMLSADPTINGFFVCSDNMLSGVISAVDAAGKTGEVTIISVDGNKSALAEIEAGNCYGDVGQYPAKVGEIAAQIACDIISGKTKASSYAKFTDAGLIFMSMKNIEEARAVAY